MDTQQMLEQLENISKLEKEIKESGNMEIALKLMTERMAMERLVRFAQIDAEKESAKLQQNPKRYHGFFQQSSDKMMVSDPCYDLDTWCQHVLEDVTIGDWMTTSKLFDEGVWGVRVTEITAFIGAEPKDTDFILQDQVDIGVDSGQAGFFDYEYYKKGKENDNKIEDEGENAYNVKGSFYSTCCGISLDNKQSGTLEQGFVSASGYGDGGYPLYVVRDAEGKVTAVKVVFISEDELEEEEE